MRTKAISVLAIIILVALLVQGCGSTSPTAVPTTAPTATASAGIAPLPDATLDENPVNLKGATDAGEPQPITCGETTDEAFIAQVIVLVNAERAKVGAGPLTENAQLKAAAKVHNNNMACLNFFDHTGQDGSRPADRVTAQGYQWANVGENIAAGQSSPEAVMNSWMNSPGHKANILNPNFTEIGVGYAVKDGSQWRRYWTQVFGRPQNPTGQPTPQPPAASPTPQPPAASPTPQPAEASPTPEPAQPTEVGAPTEVTAPEATATTEGGNGGNTGGGGAPQPISCGETTNEAFIAQVIVLVNAERAKVGAPPLTENAKLKAAAKVHNNNMACLNFFDHTGQDGSQPADRATAQGYQWANVGENIAAGSETPEAVMESWMNSEGHRANILNPDFTEIGVAFANKEGSEWGIYWTQVFGRPQQ